MDSLTHGSDFISKKAIIEIEEKFPYLKNIGIGGSTLNGVINYEQIDFIVNRELTKDEGVELISKIVDIYLSVLHAERMEFYLSNRSFDFNNLKIGLFIHTEGGESIYHPKIGIFDLSSGNIFYITNKISEDGIILTETYTKEPYEEALKRIHASKVSVQEASSQVL